MKRVPVALSFALSVTLIAGCAVPSIPLPPPPAQSIDFALDATAGTATYASTFQDPNWSLAVVSVFNANVGAGVITTANVDGTVGPTDPFPAADGDRIEITYETADRDDATGFCLVMHDGTPSMIGCP